MSDAEIELIDNTTAPWTLKGVAWEVRSAARASSHRADMGISEWVQRAILLQAKAEATAPRDIVAVPESLPPAAPVTPSTHDRIGYLRALTGIAREVDQVGDASLHRSFSRQVRAELRRLRVDFP